MNSKKWFLQGIWMVLLALQSMCLIGNATENNYSIAEQVIEAESTSYWVDEDFDENRECQLGKFDSLHDTSVRSCLHRNFEENQPLIVNGIY